MAKTKTQLEKQIGRINTEIKTVKSLVGNKNLDGDWITRRLKYLQRQLKIHQVKLPLATTKIKTTKAEDKQKKYLCPLNFKSKNSILAKAKDRLDVNLNYKNIAADKYNLLPRNERIVKQTLVYALKEFGYPQEYLRGVFGYSNHSGVSMAHKNIQKRIEKRDKTVIFVLNKINQIIKEDYEQRDVVAYDKRRLVLRSSK